MLMNLNVWNSPVNNNAIVNETFEKAPWQEKYRETMINVNMENLNDSVDNEIVETIYLSFYI